MSKNDGADKTRRRRGRSPASPASLLDDENLLWEILIRLPPQPSSLPRASAVCTRWRRLATDPKFIACFRGHHRKPPLLGVFHRGNEGIVFVPVLDPPDRIPTERLDMRRYGKYGILGCRHGRVLAINWSQGELIVCEPVTGEQHRVVVPDEFRGVLINGAILCPAADDPGHVHHGGCPFKVVLMTMYADDYRPVACVYSSETGTWGDLVKTADTCELDDAGFPGALVGNAIYWLDGREGNEILVFDLDEQNNLAAIQGPSITNDFRGCSRRIIKAEHGAVGFAILSYPRFQMWQRNVNCHGGATWVLWKTIEMHDIPGLPLAGRSTILGYSEDTDAFFIFVEGYVYMVQLKSMQSKRLHQTEYIDKYHPFTSFYTPGIAIAGGHDGVESQDTLDDSTV
uniref:Uncharacterized protein n=2 Tax=Avena sativa TaxID=4498 RepID=A0ACD5TS74_AVESA